MNSSAIASSSPVVMPGRTCSPTSASASTTTRPARAICSISWGLFRMIIVLPCCAAWSRPRRHLLERLADFGEHLVDRSIGMDADDVPTRRAVLLGSPLQHSLHQRLAVGDLEL